MVSSKVLYTTIVQSIILLLAFSIALYSVLMFFSTVREHTNVAIDVVNSIEELVVQILLLVLLAGVITVIVGATVRMVYDDYV